MADAKRDDNFVPTLIGVSSSDGTTPVNVFVDPTTHRLKVDLSGGGSGTVQTVSIATANGFAGTSDGDPSDPTLTLTTTITGILQGNGTAISAASTTGSGDVVLATSPTLVTPNIGTPSAGTLTNCTGLPISTGISGLGANVATFLATPSSANLASAVTDETGTGALVFANTPTLVTPVLGTPTSGTLTNCTGLPISTGVSGLGANVATFLATPSSANLASAITDETGSGSLVFATSPTLVTPNIGTPSAGTLTNCTGLPISTGVSGLGANVATFLATPSSANLASAVTDETGSGALVFGTSPTIGTPVIAQINDASGNETLLLGSVASAVNELTITNAATGNSPSLAATGGDTNIDIQLTPKGTGIVKGELKRFMVRLYDDTTALATGTTVGGDYRIANRAITVKEVGCYVDTAAATGSNLLTVDINEAGTSILSTKITVDVGEKTSTTAATAPVISDSAIAADAIVTFDIDQVNETTPAIGLVVWIDYVYA